ncbi:MAG: hypothetical protein JXA66_05635, partial [Oligoflexia bacterium]|nr:hypothetical protein [Oligoflexia bacterium]
MSRLGFCILIFAWSLNLPAFIFIKALDKDNFYTEGGLYVTQGTTESLYSYSIYGIAEGFELNLNIPAVYYYDDQVKSEAFYANPVAGTIVELLSGDNNLSFLSNVELPFRTPRG